MLSEIEVPVPGPRLHKKPVTHVLVKEKIGKVALHGQQTSVWASKSKCGRYINSEDVAETPSQATCTRCNPKLKRKIQFVK